MRGLKLLNLDLSLFLDLSHPTWVRGLKRDVTKKVALDVESHPTWVRGLKLVFLLSKESVVSSHPTWVRGLKQVFGV